MIGRCSSVLIEKFVRLDFGQDWGVGFMGRGRIPAVSIELSGRELEELEGLARRRRTAQGLARRARIVLLAAEGLENKATRDGFARHPRWHVHFTPTSASWLNQVERFFALLTDKQPRRGVHRSTRGPLALPCHNRT